MPQPLELPSGFTVQLRTRRELRYKHREPVMKAMELRSRLKRLDDTSIDLGSMMMSMERARIAVGVVSWDVRALDDDGEPTGDILQIPVRNPETLNELSIEDGAALVKATEWIQDALFPDFGPTPDEDSPTPPSGD